MDLRFDALGRDPVLLVETSPGSPACAGSRRGRRGSSRCSVSAYMITCPATFRAARPLVWMSERSERRNPSLSASRIATRETSGMSSPSRRRLTPMRTVELAHPEVADDVHPLQGMDVRVEVLHPDAEPFVVGRQILRHPFRQGRHEDPLAPFRPVRGSRRAGRPPGVSPVSR